MGVGVILGVVRIITKNNRINLENSLSTRNNDRVDYGLKFLDDYHFTIPATKVIVAVVPANDPWVCDVGYCQFSF